MQLLNGLFGLEGKVALVTGGYGGIGESVCRGLASVGARVAVAGHNGDKALALADDMGGGAYAAVFDAASVEQIRAMVDDVAAHYGRLDILVNCVGLNREESALDMTEETFDFVYTANLK